MSEHTKGKLSGDKYGRIYSEDDNSLFIPAGVVLGEDARRLAAAWNACKGLSTENLESIVFVGETIRVRFDSINAELRQAQGELNAARALLREIIDAGGTVRINLDDKVQSYLDACDKSGAPDAS